MIVIDASVVTDWLLHGRRTIAPGPRGSGRERLAAPHLLDAEVTHALRRHLLTGRMGARRGQAAVRVLMAAPIVRFPHSRLLSRVLELRDNVTTSDALYLALAESLGAPLLTRDTALARVPGVRVVVEVLP